MDAGVWKDLNEFSQNQVQQILKEKASLVRERKKSIDKQQRQDAINCLEQRENLRKIRAYIQTTLDNRN